MCVYAYNVNNCDNGYCKNKECKILHKICINSSRFYSGYCLEFIDSFLPLNYTTPTASSNRGINIKYSSTLIVLSSIYLL